MLFKYSGNVWLYKRFLLPTNSKYAKFKKVGIKGCQLGIFMPTFPNLANWKVVGSKKKNHLLAFQPKIPTRDFYC